MSKEIKFKRWFERGENDYIQGIDTGTNTLTEQTGYASTSEIMENLIRAGETWEDYRHAVFNPEDQAREDEVNELSDDPLPIYEIDPVLIKQRMEQRRKNREAKKQEVFNSFRKHESEETTKKEEAARKAADEQKNQKVSTGTIGIKGANSEVTSNATGGS